MGNANEHDEGSARPSPGRRARVRRILGPIAFLAALGVLASRTCEGEMAEATIAVEVAPEDTRVELQLMKPNGTEKLAFFIGAPKGEPPVATWVVQAVTGEYDLAITVHGPRGTRNLSRLVELRNRATVHVRAVGDDAR